MIEGTVDISGSAEAPAAPVSEPVSTPVAPVAEPSWRDSLSADLKDNPTLTKIADVESLAKEHVNVQKLIGADKIPRPQDDWNDQQWSDHFTRIGRPDKVDGYDLGGVEVPEGLPVSDDLQTAVVAKMHSLGLNQKQVAGVLGEYYALQGDQFTQSQGDAARTTEAGIRELQNEWGKSFGAHVDLAKRAITAAAGDGFEELAGLTMSDGTLFGDHPLVIKAFATLGDRLDEHGLVGGGQQVRTTMTPAEAAAEIDALNGGKDDFPLKYNDKNHTQHAWAVQRMNELFEMKAASSEGA